MGLKIEEIWAYVAIDPYAKPGDEGIIGAKAPGSNVMLPFVCADKARIESLRPIAEDMAKSHNVDLKLIRFSKREVVEVINKATKLN